MSRGELLLELLSEEIPARMQRRAIDDLTALVRDKLAAAEIPAAEVRGSVTPRRLTVMATGIPERQPDRSEERRRDIIAADLKKRAAEGGVEVKSDPGLLDEVTGLAEFPVVLMGRIDDASMELPAEVLATAMRTHQKYFSCLKQDGAPAPRFLFIANNKTPDDGRTIVAGNERVLKARLADARFFWDQDRKIPLASRVDAFKDRVYYEKLGTVFDKVVRIEQLARFLVPHVFGADETHSRRAALLSKAD